MAVSTDVITKNKLELCRDTLIGAPSLEQNIQQFKGNSV